MTGGTVVILGGTRRNFAAGMSGIAYVLDEKGDFNIRFNPAMVELEKITEDEADEDAMAGLDTEQDEEGQELPKDMLAHDALRLKMLIERHIRYTDSARGKMILERWAEYLPKFVKVMPMEYRRVLESQLFQQRS
uniref:GXGXG motif-containing protein n=1 Tax=Candidatus Kentrum sp. SD TaxID=2126332 RepID=A0A451BN43_9GAMM|nr:MAG: GXGXG motif-containing protein [Candidatus Kentron sp. SD]